MTTGEVDAAARDTLARRASTCSDTGRDTDWGSTCTGAASHRRSAEAPGTDRLEAGMVFTIEPGAYVDSTGGVRIEDDVVRLEGGCDLLTDVPRGWRVIAHDDLRAAAGRTPQRRRGDSGAHRAAGNDAAGQRPTSHPPPIRSRTIR